MPPPARLAWYIAASARLNSVSRVVGVLGEQATPIDAPTWNSAPETSKGAPARRRALAGDLRDRARPSPTALASAKKVSPAAA